MTSQTDLTGIAAQSPVMRVGDTRRANFAFALRRQQRQDAVETRRLNSFLVPDTSSPEPAC